MKKFIFFTLILALFLCVFVSASDKLSPALDVIASDYQMIKTGIVYKGDVTFDANDFDTSTGAHIKSITISSLPDEKAGKLMIGNLYVVENQLIERDSLSSLKFVPSGNEELEASFSFFANGSSYETECVVKTIKNVNFSPVASNGASVSAWTQKNISCFGSLSAYDPEGDELNFEIVSYPEKGLVEITNAKTGDYRYTPYCDAKGNDAFSYRVCDSFGNYSEICTVKIKIDKLKTSLVFSDMSGNRAQNAALVAAAGKFMNYKMNGDGTYSFNPDEKITMEEFVTLIMKAMGAKDVPTLEKTRFADDAEISPEHKGYAESAFVLGIVKGTNKTDGVYFEPKKEVSVAEGAVIINNIMKASPKNERTALADKDDIPDFAKESLFALNELGVIPKENGKINPNSPLNRAQTAQILMSLLERRGKLSS